eukprot:3906172-Rhodomonas_salina.1
MDNGFVGTNASNALEHEDDFPNKIAFEVASITENMQCRMASILTEIHGKYIAKIMQLQRDLEVQRQRHETSHANLKRKFQEDNTKIAQSVYRQINEEQAKKKCSNLRENGTQTDVYSKYTSESTSNVVVMYSELAEPDEDLNAVVRQANPELWALQTHVAPPPPLF